jgi:NAD+ kinase
VIAVEIKEASDLEIFMMFDPGHSLAERILREQFDY